MGLHGLQAGCWFKYADPTWLPLLLLETWSTQSAPDTDGRSAIYSHVGYLPRTPPHLVPLSYEQVPHNKRRAEDACSPEQLLRRTAPLRRALELLVSTPNVLRCIERVFNELVDVRLLHAEVGRERRVQF